MTEPQTTHELDFYQAMADFRIMFPNMDEEVIEAVLRSNNGAVDSTIDQLLTMNVDFVPGSRGTTAAVQRAHRPRQDSSSGSDVDPFEPPPYPTKAPTAAVVQATLGHTAVGHNPRDAPPPSYQEYTSSMSPPKAADASTITQPAIESTPADSLLDLPVPCSGTGATGSMGDTKHFIGALGGNVDVGFTPANKPIQSLPPKVHSAANTGVWGEALSILPPQPAAPQAQMPKSMPLFDHNYTATPKPESPSHKLSFKTWDPPLLGDLPEDFLRIKIICPAGSMSASSSPALSPGRVNGGSPREGHPSPHSSSSLRSMSPVHRTSPGELSAAVVQQRLVENEAARHGRHGNIGAEKAQMLDDERLALMLQNEEFLQELQSDQEFMRTLEHDHMNATAFEPPQLQSPDLDPNRPKSDFMEGYGDDREMTLAAFPFERTAGAEGPGSSQAEFKRQLKNMGGSSKKKFVTAAKKFFSRKKKSPKTMYPHLDGYRDLDSNGQSDSVPVQSGYTCNVDSSPPTLTRSPQICAKSHDMLSYSPLV